MDEIALMRDIVKWKDEIIMSLLQKIEHDKQTTERLRETIDALEECLANSETQIQVLEQQLSRELK